MDDRGFAADKQAEKITTASAASLATVKTFCTYFAYVMP
jgi:hypothetical protein